MTLRPNRHVDLDYQATTPCDPRVVQGMLPWFNENFGNPHSVEHAHLLPHGLRAPGIDADTARRTLRIGIGRFTSPADIDFAVAALAAAHASVASHPIEA